jgi:hypothetical protein
MPVVFGDKGAAIMGAGTEYRFCELPVAMLGISSAALLRIGVLASRSAYRASNPVSLAGIGLSVRSNTESGDSTWFSTIDAALGRSTSNLPFTASKL